MAKSMDNKVYFDGTGDVQSFVEKVELMATLKGHNTNEPKATFIASRLVGTAFDVYRRMSADDKKDPEKLKENLKKEFCREERNREEALNALMSASRQSGDTPQAYAYKVVKWVQLAYSSLDDATQGTIAKDYFLKGLSSELQVAIKSIDKFADKTIAELSDEATRLEIAGVGVGVRSTIAGIATTSETDLVERITAGVIEKLTTSDLLDTASGGNTGVNAIGYGDQGRGGRNFRGGFRGRYNSRRGSHAIQNSQTSKKCRSCQQPGHLFRNCPERHCQACGGKGHDAWSTTCPNYS